MPAPYKMGRPKKLPPVVYRVQLSRPYRGDSVIVYRTTSPEEIKQKYGERVMLITKYVKE